jgi:MerR family transcriptional regulator/heat shock protein HspR
VQARASGSWILETEQGMNKEYWTASEVVEIFELDGRFLQELEQEEIIFPLQEEHSPDKLFPPSELEKLRLAKLLVEDMGVNLAGVEIILRMRQTMFDMRMQFDAILEDLSRQVRKVLDERVG